MEDVTERIEDLSDSSDEDLDRMRRLCGGLQLSAQTNPRYTSIAPSRPRKPRKQPLKTALKRAYNGLRTPLRALERA